MTALLGATNKDFKEQICCDGKIDNILLKYIILGYINNYIFQNGMNSSKKQINYLTPKMLNLPLYY
jgi:hypothetical protein